MRDGELNGLDPGEIGPRQAHAGGRAGALDCWPSISSSAPSTASSAGTAGQAHGATAVLQQAANLEADHGEHHQPRVGRDFGQDPLEMLLRAHHRPEMADDIGIVELRQGRLGDHLERLAGRIRKQVQMQAGTWAGRVAFRETAAAGCGQPLFKPWEGRGDNFIRAIPPRRPRSGPVVLDRGTKSSTGLGIGRIARA